MIKLNKNPRQNKIAWNLLDKYLKTQWDQHQNNNSIQEQYTPLNLWVEILNKLNYKNLGDVLVVSNIELYLLLKNLKKDNIIDYKSVTFLTDIKHAKGKENVKVVDFNNLENLTFDMKFDIIIGNPPYNDSLDSQVKKNGAMTGNANLYKKFIHKSSCLLDDKGIVAFILPLGAYRDFIKAGFHINKGYFNPVEIFGKEIATMNWYVNKDKTSPFIFETTLQDKIFYTSDVSKLTERLGEKGFFPYNYFNLNKEIHTSVSKNQLSPNEKRGYQYCYNLEETDINKVNLIFLLTFLQKYIRGFCYQQYQFNKRLKYQWLEGLTHKITKEDIIQQYQLTEEEVKEITEG